ncbi:MAG: glycosyltransferase, partial [Qipengyuania sp.]
MTRVLHVLDHSLPLHSGYTFRTRAIMKAQQAAGIDVRAVTGLRQGGAQPADCEEIDGLVFHRTAGKRATLPVIGEALEIAALARAIRAVIAAWEPDIVHAHSPALCGLAALGEARRAGLPFVYEIRAFWEDAAVGNGTGRTNSVKYLLTRFLENRVVRKADAVFTICKGLRDDLVARGHDRNKLHLSPNGVDLTLFGDPPPRDDALAKEVGLGEGPVIGFIGSFYDYEGLDDLIAAMPLLRERHPAKLLLVGGGPMDASLRKQATREAAIFAWRV